jgi:hypothetical protein
LVSQPPTPEGLMPLPVMVELYSQKVPSLCLLAHQAIIFLRCGRLLPFDPLHLFGERDVFECALYERISCLRRAVFGLGRSLSILIRP